MGWCKSCFFRKIPCRGVWVPQAVGGGGQYRGGKGRLVRIEKGKKMTGGRLAGKGTIACGYQVRGGKRERTGWGGRL